jgi:hypothetical protein
VLAWLFLLPRVEPGRKRRLCSCRFHKQKNATWPERLKDVAEKFCASRQAEPVHGVNGHHDIIVSRQIAPPVWFRQITHPRPPADTIAAIYRAAQRDKELIPIHEIDPRVRKSRVNDAACVAWPAAHVQNSQALVNWKWNRCGDELQRGWLGGTLFRAPQIEPCVEIFAAKFLLDLGLSRDSDWLLPLPLANAPIRRYRTRTAGSYWKNLTALDGGCLLVASPLQEFEGTQSGERPELVDEMGLVVVAATES